MWTLLYATVIGGTHECNTFLFTRHLRYEHVYSVYSLLLRELPDWLCPADSVIVGILKIRSGHGACVAAREPYEVIHSVCLRISLVYVVFVIMRTHLQTRKRLCDEKIGRYHKIRILYAYIQRPRFLSHVSRARDGDTRIDREEYLSDRLVLLEIIIYSHQYQ